MPTLLEVLQRKNPDFTDHWAGSSYNNTTSSRFDEVTLDDTSRAHVQEWKDFTFGSIYAAYGDILDQQLPPTYKEVQTPSATPTTIIDENGIDTLGIQWSTNIVRQPLKAAGIILRQQRGIGSTPSTGNPEPTLASKLISWKHTTDAGASIKPDWAVLDRAISKPKGYRHAHKKDNPAKPLVYVVGDSKLKQKWKSAWLSLGDSACTVNTDPPYVAPGAKAPKYQKTKDIKAERLNPLKQLATYCRYGETRYGFLLTQTELVAMRIRRIPGTGPSPAAAVEYRAIPWSAQGQGRLTAHLAIWALGCMGMNDKHRAMESDNNAPLQSMAKLTWWQEDKTKGTFTNVISRRVLNAADWAKLMAKLGNPTFHTDDNSGNSFTATFTTGPAVPSLTQAMANLNLNKASGTPPATPQKGASAATPSSSTKPKSPTKCKIGGQTYALRLAKDKTGYEALDSKQNVKYKVVKNTKNQWVVSGTSTVVVLE